MLWKKVVHSDQAEKGTSSEFRVRAVTAFMKLFAVASCGKPCGVFVSSGRARGEEAAKVGVTLRKRDSVKETEHGHVATECVWGEVVVKESIFRRYVELTEKGFVEVVKRLEGGSGGVIRCAGGGFDEREHVGLVLVCERECRVERFGAENGFQFWSRFGKCFIYGLIHSEFGVDERAKETESGACAVVGVYNAELFLERIESDSVSSPPCMN